MANTRTLPHAVEAERSILGAILINNELIHAAVEVGIDSKDFYLESHQKIFETISSLSQSGAAIDLVTLSSALKDRNWFTHIGGQDALVALFDDAFAASNITHYAKIVREKAILRRMIEVTIDIQSKAFDGVTEMEAFLDDSERLVFSVSDTKTNQTFSSMRDVLVQNINTIEELSRNQGDVVGLATGFHNFDKLTSGLKGGQLVVLAARPAMGKTSLFLSAVQNIALDGKSVCAIFSLEMSKEELGFRMLSGMARLDSKRLRIGRLSDRDWPRLAKAADGLSKARIHIDDSGDLTVMDVRARCRRLMSKEKRLDLIVVDYLQLMKGSKSASKGDGSREREISEISRNLKGLAKELNVPIIALSQLNRGVESRQDKRPMLSDLRESGAIEQDADIVCFIYRDEVYNKETADKGIAEIIVAKHRAGETATIRLAWISEYTLFGNLEGGPTGNPV